ncbi:MAG: metallophosphoesterase [Candidatus Krumholzibacteriia bacterium]
MKSWLWMSDIHLNFVEPDEAEGFLRRVAHTPHDGVLVGGDLAEYPGFAALLMALARCTPAPVWFVLGNHDAYRGSLREMRRLAGDLDATVDNLHWLDVREPFLLDDETALVGHSCWGDGRNGDVGATSTRLNDWIHIEELSGLSHGERVATLARLGDEAAAHLEKVVPAAVAQRPHVAVLTHVPPFSGVNMRGDDLIRTDDLPFYTCAAAGEVLLRLAQENPGHRFTVLSGHTHGGGTYEVLPNLTAHTFGTQYGAPRWLPAPL